LASGSRRRRPAFRAEFTANFPAIIVLEQQQQQQQQKVKADASRQMGPSTAKLIAVLQNGVLIILKRPFKND
jgi:hypothetical protein